MTELLSQTGRILLMVLFLCASACCSGTETAVFSLSRRQILHLRRSGERWGRLIADLLDKPSDLLGALLLGNLIVNTLFFAASSVLMLAVERQNGMVAAALVALATFFSLVLFGEILPKSMAYAHPERFSRITALPLALLVRLLTPGVRIVRLFISEPCLRLLLGPRRQAKDLTGDEFKALIEASRQQGLITPRQGRLFADIVDLNLLRVRHVMRPRVDLVACDIRDDVAKVYKRMQSSRSTLAFVGDGNLDELLGMVTCRDLLLQPDHSLSELLHPVLFVPEQKSVESLLQYFRKMRVDTVAVVDEYGGVAGAVQVEDIAQTLFGPLEVKHDQEPVQQVGPFQYRLAGHLAIYEWGAALGVELDQVDVATVGGWVTMLLGRLPHPGDEVTWQHLRFRVESVEQHRVGWVLLSIGSHE